MGLAASQARFLAITSRKMNCEFQSMQIAQEKLSVTRAMQTAAQKYQNSLSASKLVWTTGMDETYDLSYDLIMTPSALNDYIPTLITDSTGRILLSDTMFNAAVSAGVINKDGSPATQNHLFDRYGNTSGDPADYYLGARDNFINSLINYGCITPSIGEDAKKVTYESDAGLGGELPDTTIATAVTTNAFIAKLKGKTTKEINNTTTTTINYPASEILKAFGFKDDTTGDSTNVTMVVNGSDVTTNLSDVSIGDLLEGDYVLLLNGEQDMQGSLVPNAINTIAKLLGYTEEGITGEGLNVDAESYDALAQAIEFTKEDIANGGSSIEFPPMWGDIGKWDILKEGAANCNGFLSLEIKGTKQTAISLTNLLKTFLTNFAIACEGFSETSFNVEPTASGSTFVTDDLNYYFMFKEPDINPDNPNKDLSSTQISIGGFYNMLYNQLCTYGAVSDTMMQQMATDPQYLSEAIKNGRLFVSSLSNDGYYYQGAYALNEYITEIDDEAAKARAETEYEIEKSKLSYREQTLDLKMKNIDTELSALTTEYDTVKNLISKNVEKVFTMFSS